MVAESHEQYSSCRNFQQALYWQRPQAIEEVAKERILPYSNTKKSDEHSSRQCSTKTSRADMRSHKQTIEERMTSPCARVLIHRAATRFLIALIHVTNIVIDRTMVCWAFADEGHQLVEFSGHQSMAHAWFDV